MIERLGKALRVWRAVLALGLSCLALTAVADDERVVLQFDIVQPRSFGYHIGDRFSREVKLVLRSPYVLDMTSLPAAGRFSEFLALDAPRIASAPRDGATFYDIRFDYQVVNVGAEAASIAVPHHDLAYSDAKEHLKALVPDTRITVTPLRAEGDTGLQPDAAPVPLAFDTTRLWACAVALALSLLALTVIHGKLPSGRRARPFSRAFDEVRAAQGRGWRDEDYETALRAVHRAFNATAGRAVFADALDEFFNGHPAFRRLEAPLVEFFARSRGHFFSAAGDAVNPRYSAAELVALMKRCRDVERGLE